MKHRVKRTLAERYAIVADFRKANVSLTDFCNRFNVGKDEKHHLKLSTLSDMLSHTFEDQSQLAFLAEEKQASRHFVKNITAKTAQYLWQSNLLRGPEHSHVGPFRIARAALRQVYYWTRVVPEANRIFKVPVIDRVFRTGLKKGYPALFKHHNPPCTEIAASTTTHLNTHKQPPEGINIEVRFVDEAVGYGLWTNTYISNGTKICAYDGPIVPSERHAMLDDEYYLKIGDTGLAINAIHGHSCFARYANDNFVSLPNCYWLREPGTNQIWLQAGTDIRANTELTVRYTADHWRDDIAANTLPPRLREQVLKTYPELGSITPMEKKQRPRPQKRKREEEKEVASDREAVDAEGLK